MRAIVVTAVLWGVLVASNIAADVAAVDAFLADSPKHLFGPPPEFGAATFHRRDDYEWTAVWPIADSLGVVTTGQLRFVVRPGLSLGPSISVIFDREAVARLDIVPPRNVNGIPFGLLQWGYRLKSAVPIFMLGSITETMFWPRRNGNCPVGNHCRPKYVNLTRHFHG